MRQRKGSQAGFSLIEVLVAVFVFIVGMLAVATVQVDSLSYNARSNTRSVATSLAQGVLEQILVFDSNNDIFDANNLGMVWDLDPNSAATTINIVGAGDYSATWDVRTDTPVNNVAEVSVTVNGPNNRTVTLTGYKRFL